MRLKRLESKVHEVLKQAPIKFNNEKENFICNGCGSIVVYGIFGHYGLLHLNEECKVWKDFIRKVQLAEMEAGLNEVV